VAVAWPHLITGNALGNAEKAPANNRIVMGFIGVGGMGNHHLPAMLGERRVQVVAVCDVDQGHREGTAARVGKDCKTYKDFRELLDRPDIDAVLIATPDHWHALVAIAACKAGKDMYCEKPLTLTIGEGRALADTVRRYDRVFQTGSQQRSGREFWQACMLARNGYLGDIYTVYSGLPGGPAGTWDNIIDPPPGLDWDFWLGPAPKVPYTPPRCHGNFRWFYDYSGGTMTDWGAHHNDIAQWGLGTSLTGPIHVDGRGEFPKDGLFETATSFRVTYTYANGVKLICSTVGNGTKFVGTKGWVHVDRGFIQADPPSLLKEEFQRAEVRLEDTYLKHPDNWVAHKLNFLDCVESRRRPIADVEIGHRTITLSHLGVISMRLGRPLRWDPDREQVIGDPEAARWVRRPMRAPWHL
jgi:predicted dehydrogenase